ncbi:MAG: hypothetical protein F6K28_62850 [Microcoleus sp. SIO2G3]|nr:hypothetical protein [Microcoleus sp. SIO2G3]
MTASDAARRIVCPRRTASAMTACISWSSRSSSSSEKSITPPQHRHAMPSRIAEQRPATSPCGAPGRRRPHAPQRNPRRNLCRLFRFDTAGEILLNI